MRRVAEDYGLVDLELKSKSTEERLQADNFDSKGSQQCGIQANEHMISKETPVGIQAQHKT